METEETKKRQIDNLRSSTSNYWIALLTSNTIIVAIFATAVVSNSNNKILVFVLIFISLFCSYLIIKNFHTIKNLDYNIGESLDKNQIKVNYGQLLKQAEIWHQKVKNREKLVEKLLIAEAILILIIVAISTFNVFPKEKTKILLNNYSCFHYNNWKK